MLHKVISLLVIFNKIGCFPLFRNRSARGQAFHSFGLTKIAKIPPINKLKKWTKCCGFQHPITESLWQQTLGRLSTPSRKIFTQKNVRLSINCFIPTPHWLTWKFCNAFIKLLQSLGEIKNEILLFYTLNCLYDTTRQW